MLFVPKMDELAVQVYFLFCFGIQLPLPLLIVLVYDVLVLWRLFLKIAFFQFQSLWLLFQGLLICDFLLNSIVVNITKPMVANDIGLLISTMLELINFQKNVIVMKALKSFVLRRQMWITSWLAVLSKYYQHEVE